MFALISYRMTEPTKMAGLSSNLLNDFRAKSSEPWLYKILTAKFYYSAEIPKPKQKRLNFAKLNEMSTYRLRALHPGKLTGISVDGINWIIVLIYDAA